MYRIIKQGDTFKIQKKSIWTLWCWTTYKHFYRGGYIDFPFFTVKEAEELINKWITKKDIEVIKVIKG